MSVASSCGERLLGNMTPAFMDLLERWGDVTKPKNLPQIEEKKKSITI